jgi:hypothetical protein
MLAPKTNYTQLGLNLSGSIKNHKRIAMDQMLHSQFSQTTECFQQYNAL